MESARILVFGVRFVCAVLFVSYTYWSLRYTWKPFLSLIGLIASFVILKPTRENSPPNQPRKKKEKTADILKTLYPSMSSTDEDLVAAQSIYRLVSYDAQSTQSLENFENVKQNSNCVFARNAKLWGSPMWSKDSSVEDNVYRMLPMFLKFSVVCASQKLDGFLLELPGDIYGASIEVFAGALREVLTSISDRDPTSYCCMNKSFVGKRGWVFEFNKVTFFITTFAPFYPESHPRYTFGNTNCYILFQPELSFAFHDLPPDTPNTNWEQPQTVRDKIRLAFKKAGRPFHVPDSVFSPMALEMLRPINQTDSVIEWWKKT